ncbi:SDR family NAD(P)-dependent oxidoreductase [Kiritimatiellaeota bacterium B1221]|nr:SDR family NAD(P)-dependent oxidoreductase [Kiritimatiellaeota bacterium B1221]
MKKTILITGATDGIGLETAKNLMADGHQLLLHGRNPTKLAAVAQHLSSLGDPTGIETYIADFSRLNEVKALAQAVSDKHATLDVLINNAGIFMAPETITEDGLDIRFVVNSLAPYLLTQKLLPLLMPSSRVVNLSSAAQSPVDLTALKGEKKIADMAAYAQSKLALTMWTFHLAASHPEGPVFAAVNPASLLGCKMVKQGFGVTGGDLQIGADILVRAALSDEFANASGQYYDNDQKCFAPPHPDALNPAKANEVFEVMNSILNTEPHRGKQPFTVENSNSVSDTV